MSAPYDSSGIGHLRCSDSDRELVADVLARAFSEGRITFEEHDERLGRAYAARTFAELDGLTADLIPTSPTPPAVPGGHGQVPERRSPVQPPAGGPVLRNSTTVMTTLKPGAPLHVPEETTLVVVLGDAKIDLVNATFARDVVRLNLNIFMGDVRIRLPEGVRIVNAVNNIMGDVKASDMSPAPSSVTVELHGTTVMGSIRLLGPTGKPGKYQRFVR